jgi:hypothetical protein
MKKTRFIPYGYTIREGRTVIEHTEAEIIREIFDEYIKGASLKDIAENLTQRRIPYTEKTDVWDKARIARIIDNAKYIGDEEYDPIIDEDTYEGAVSMKAARQRNTVQKECEGIALLRNRVKCEDCGSPMVRRICSKRHVKESWTCQNAECGKRLRISDGDLLQKITILMNRIIENSELLIPKPKTRIVDSPTVANLQRQVDAELGKDHPSEEYIVEKISDIASQLYKETQAKKIIVAQIARKRASMMKPQENFNCDYFSDLIDYITLSSSGKVRLHTKVGTEITEGENE